MHASDFRRLISFAVTMKTGQNYSAYTCTKTIYTPLMGTSVLACLHILQTRTQMARSQCRLLQWREALTVPSRQMKRSEYRPAGALLTDLNLAGLPVLRISASQFLPAMVHDLKRTTRLSRLTYNASGTWRKRFARSILGWKST